MIESGFYPLPQPPVPNHLFKTRCSAVVKALRSEPPSKTPSLIATVFGDIVEAHGGEIWLGSLTRLLQPLGISERLARTAVYRLSQDGSLESIKSGRRSYYRLTPSARLRVDRFDRRIYYFNEPEWDGEWRLVFTGFRGISAAQRAEVRRRMDWLGYGIIAPNVYGHPNAPAEPLRQLMEELGITDKVSVMRARNHDRAHGLGSREMVRHCFDIERLEKAYAAFIQRYRPLALALQQEGGSSDMNPEHCLIIRVMLIHQFRRILLHDPWLPTPLLPAEWSGFAAQRLCAVIYRAVENASNAQIRAVGEDRNGAFRAVTPRHRGRFAGLNEILSRTS